MLSSVGNNCIFLYLYNNIRLVRESRESINIHINREMFIEFNWFIGTLNDFTERIQYFICFYRLTEFIEEG